MRAMTLDSGEGVLEEPASGKCCVRLLGELFAAAVVSPDRLRLIGLTGDLGWDLLSLTRCPVCLEWESVAEIESVTHFGDPIEFSTHPRTLTATEGAPFASPGPRQGTSNILSVLSAL